MASESIKSTRRVGRPNADEVAAINRRIREAGLAAFARDGFASAQMESIAADATVSKAALYRRYPSKNALLEAIIQVEAEECFAALKAEAVGSDPIVRLKATMKMYRAQRQRPRQVELLRLIAASLKHDLAIGGKLDAMRVGYVQPVDSLIEEAIAAGMIRPSPIFLLREAMFDLLVNGTTSQLLLGITPDDDEGVFEFRWQLLMGVIGTVDRSRRTSSSV